MTSIKRFASALAFSFFLFFSTQAQTPSVSTVNVTAEQSNVRISASGDVMDMRVVVSDESGDVVFESGPVAGDKLDWTMRDAQGQRVPAGSYTLSVTYRASNGKLKRRVEQVFVTEEAAGSTSTAQESAAPTPAAPVDGAGTAGRIAKFTTANQIGNSVMFESAGRIGLGTAVPQQSLHAVGPSSRLRLQSTNGPALTTTEYVTNGRVWQAGAGGSTAAGGVANKFFVLDQTANQYRLVIDAAGNFGVGTVTPASRLTVNGGIQILGAGNGIKFADGSIQTKATAGTITGTGTTNRLAKFTGANSFGNSSVTEVSGKVGIGTASPAVAGLHIGAGVSGGQAQLRLDNSNGQNGGLNRWTNRLEMMSSDAIGFSTGGVSSPDMWITTDGFVGLNTLAPAARLHVVGELIIDSAVPVLHTGTGASEHNRYLSLINAPGLRSASGLKAGGVLVADSYDYANPGKNDLVVKGNVAVGTNTPAARLHVTAPGTAVYATSPGHAVEGISTGNTGIGVYGKAPGNVGVFGTSPFIGVQGNTTGDGQGVRGDNGGSNTVGYAGLFNGRVGIAGMLTKGSGSFKIDHPLDPANKYLYHSFVESPEMKNIYDGVVVTDARGEAGVELPAYFEALNKEFRYQLTVIGPAFAQAIVSDEIKGNRFRIRTDRPNVKVSWQVTGVRHDAYAEANRVPVEEEKQGVERGRYQYPEAYGQPVERGVDWAMRPPAQRQSPEQARQQSPR